MRPGGISSTLGRSGTHDSCYLVDPSPETVGSGERTSVTVVPSRHILPLYRLSTAFVGGDPGDPGLCAFDPDPGGNTVWCP